MKKLDRLFSWKKVQGSQEMRWELPFATVWASGDWHTWDVAGGGAENSSESTVGQAKVEAIASAFHQGFIQAHIEKAIQSELRLMGRLFMVKL